MRYLALPLAMSLCAPSWAQTATDQADEPVTDTAAVIETAIPDVSFGAAESVTIVQGEARHEIMAEIASTPLQQARGLMYRDSLDENAGMLFHYQPPQPAAMWMENTLIPLDILFINAEGEVVKIIANAQPGSRRSLPAEFVVAGVLELAGGQAVARELRPGAIIEHPFFQSTAETDEAAVEGVATAAEETE